jgi:Arc/MetJ-type ribon-helix-helix transcriptional regulator
MNLPLDPASEQLIQRELDRGHFNSPSEVVARALQLLDAEEDWLLRNKEVINLRLKESMEQAKRGETYTPEEAARILDERIMQRAR